METAWSTYSEGTTRSMPSTTAAGRLQGGLPTLPGASKFREAAASLHSPWPMATWAIEAEAALMEVETIHHQHSATPGYDFVVHSAPIPRQQGIQASAAGAQASLWSQEFSRLDSATATSGSSDNTKAENDPESLSQDRSTIRRGSMVKTCGFMLETKNQRDTSDPTLFDPESFSFSATSTPSQRDAHSTKPDASHLSDASIVQQSSTSDPPMYHSPISDHHIVTTHLEDIRTEPKERSGQVFNDDLFEGDMLQAWMETLAQEKQEADERLREKEQARDEETAKRSAEDEAKDQLILEAAVRRLNALMWQLNRKQGGLQNLFGGGGGGSVGTNTKGCVLPIPDIQGQPNAP